jgi:hypothetical protein
MISKPCPYVKQKRKCFEESCATVDSSGLVRPCKYYKPFSFYALRVLRRKHSRTQADGGSS